MVPYPILETTRLKRHAGILARCCRSHGGLRWRIWDILVGIIAFTGGFIISPYHETRLPASYYLLSVGGLYGVLLMIVARCAGVPRPERTQSFYELLSSSVLAILGAYVLLNTLVGLVLVRTYGRYIFLGITAISFAGLFFPRMLVTKLLSVEPWHILVYGAGEKGVSFIHRLTENRLFRVVGLLDSRGGMRGRDVCGLPVWGCAADVTMTDLSHHNIGLVVICARESLSRNEMRTLLGFQMCGVPILTKAGFFEYYYREISLDYADLHWFADAPLLWGRGPRLALKRILDIGAAVAGIVVTFPAWVVACIMIKLTSPGPVFFKQQRVGQGGKIFEIYKFRSMHTDAEKNGAQWATPGDPRVTRFGRVMRVTRWDELPQFINVLRGDMSIVGPRPERPEFVKEFEETIPFYAERHVLPPGLTGWAQVRYRYAASKEDTQRKLQYDLYYCRHASLMFDFEIILRTIPMVMKGSR